jgi:hypothetical protein
MEIEPTVIRFFGILFLIIFVFFPNTQLWSVSEKTKHQPEMDLKDIRLKSIMWNH